MEKKLIYTKYRTCKKKSYVYDQGSTKISHKYLFLLLTVRFICSPIYFPSYPGYGRLYRVYIL